MVRTAIFDSVSPVSTKHSGNISTNTWHLSSPKNAWFIRGFEPNLEASPTVTKDRPLLAAFFAKEFFSEHVDGV